MKTLSEITLEMDSEKSLRELAAERARGEYLSRQPRLSMLLDQKKQLGLALLKSSLLPSSDSSHIRSDIDAVNRQIAEEFGDWESAFQPDYSCAVCRDTGYYDDGRPHMCACLLEKVYKDILGGADISALKGSFEEYDVSAFSTPEQRAKMKQMLIYSKKTVSRLPCPVSTILLMGKSGLGKSYLMSCMAKELKRSADAVLYIDAFSLFSAFHRVRLGEELPLSPVFDAEALFIDDLGTEPMTQNVTREYMFKLTESRINAGKLTVLSTNLTMPQLIERYTEKITSRLFSSETGAVLRFEGSDVRL